MIFKWFPSDSKVKEGVSDDWIKERMGMKRKERERKGKRGQNGTKGNLVI